MVQKALSVDPEVTLISEPRIITSHAFIGQHVNASALSMPATVEIGTPFFE